MAITGGLLVVTGVALLAVGLTRKKKATMAALPSFSLVAGRGGASFAVGGRF
jgi:nitrate/nitrite transporter NarK